MYMYFDDPDTTLTQHHIEAITSAKRSFINLMLVELTTGSILAY
jgi:hypothetical protein